MLPLGQDEVPAIFARVEQTFAIKRRTVHQTTTGFNAATAEIALVKVRVCARATHGVQPVDVLVPILHHRIEQGACCVSNY